MRPVLVEGAFDDLDARDLRFLEEAAGLGPLTVRLTRNAPKFPFAERAYVLGAVRGVARVIGADESPQDGLRVIRESDPAVRGAHVIAQRDLADFSVTDRVVADGKTVAVTGCFDWLHSGHVRFFAEAARFGALHVFLGNDACIRDLKGPRHPKFPAAIRAYCVSRMKDVARVTVSRGMGLLDADAEIRALKPDVFVVNEDGDKGGKRQWCESLGIEYRVLRRVPADGLDARSSTALRGY